MTETPTPVLDAREIRHGFGDREILQGVSLHVAPGQTLAIIGPNGAGKTTLLKILAGVLSPDTGDVRLQDDALATLSRREVARRIAVVPQSSAQVFGFTLLEFVLMGYHARTDRFALPSQAQVDGALQALADLELRELAGASVASLSGGELQRALLARALVADVPLWLLDEPTASLDVRHQIALLDRVRLHADQGGAVIAILHDLALVHRYFDAVAILHEGRLHAIGPPEDLLTPELLSEVFGVALDRLDADGRTLWFVR